MEDEGTESRTLIETSPGCSSLLVAAVIFGLAVPAGYGGYKLVTESLDIEGRLPLPFVVGSVVTASFVLAIVAFLMARQYAFKPIHDILVGSLMIGIVTTITPVIVMLLPNSVSPNQEPFEDDIVATVSDLNALEQRFMSAGLSEYQALQVAELVERSGLVTMSELPDLVQDSLKAAGITPEDLDKIHQVLDDALNEDQVLEIVDERIEDQIRLALVPPEPFGPTSCVLTSHPSTGANVRLRPRTDSKPLGVLSDGQEVSVIGHNGGFPGTDKWWLVLFMGQEGWVFSGATRAENDVLCALAPRIPGLVPLPEGD